MKWLFILMVIAGTMSAESISEIRELYSGVKEMIDSGEGMYLTELEINSEGAMYPALGSYNRSFKFYWGLDQDHYPTSQLLLITVDSQYAAVEQYEEFLYNNSGELVFYFSSGGYDMAEERFYFDEEYLQRYICDGESTDSPDHEAWVKGERMLLESDRLFQAFYLVH